MLFIYSNKVILWVVLYFENLPFVAKLLPRGEREEELKVEILLCKRSCWKRGFQGVEVASFTRNKNEG